MKLLTLTLLTLLFLIQKKLAEAFGRKFSGSVSPNSIMVDGVKAYRVSIPANFTELKPRECVVVQKAGKACLIIGGSMLENDIWTPMDEILKTWHWK